MENDNTSSNAPTVGVPSTDSTSQPNGPQNHGRPPAQFGPRPPPYPPAGYPMPAPMPHPSGWSEHMGPTGQPYYYNVFTRQSTWKRPPELDQPLPMPMPAGPPTVVYNMPRPGVGGMEPPPSAATTTMMMTGTGASTQSPSAGQSSASGSTKSNKSGKKNDKAKKARLIPGTVWKLVETVEGREFYFNTETKQSVWTIPEEIKEAVESMKAAEREEAKRKAEAVEQAEQTKRHKPDTTEGTEMTEDDIMYQLQMLREEALLEAHSDAETSQAGSTQQDATPAEAEKPPLTAAQKEEIFRELLRDAGVTAFSFWEKELPKLAADPRFSVVDSLKARKDIFDNYCKQLVENKKQGAAASTVKRTPVEKYNALLEKETTRHTRWEDFSRKFKRDSRFLGVSITERERLFREHIKKLEQQEQEQKSSNRKELREDFMQLLRETRRINAETSWRRARELICDDPRYKAITSSEDREDYFYEYRRELEKQEQERRARREREEEERERKRREEASLRERKHRVHRERMQRDREARGQRALVDKEEAIRNFQTLLVDRIHHHTTTWADAQPDLHRDNRFDRCMEVLGNDELQRLYNEHVDAIYRARRKAFEKLIDDCVPLHMNDWEKAQALFTDMQPLRQMRASDDELKRLFSQHQEARLRRAREELDQLLSEHPFIKFHAHEGTLDLKSVFDVLQEDERYLQLSFMAEERDKIVEAYVTMQIEQSGRKQKEHGADSDDDALELDND